MHICRRQNCKCSYSSHHPITKVNDLKILGIYVNKKYNWHTHIINLINQLNKFLGIIHYFSKKKFNTNPLFIIHLMKDLILSRTNYSLLIYSKSSNNYLNKINTIINSSIRLGLGAFRTTSRDSLLKESGIFPIQQ